MSAQPDLFSFLNDTLTRLEGKLDAGLSRLEAKLDAKADKADLAAIEGELRGHAGRITALERAEDLRKAKAEVHRERDERAFFTRKNKWAVIGSMITLASGLVLAVTSVIGILH